MWEIELRRTVALETLETVARDFIDHPLESLEIADFRDHPSRPTTVTTLETARDVRLRRQRPETLETPLRKTPSSPIVTRPCI